MDVDGTVAVTDVHYQPSESSGIVLFDSTGKEKAYFTTGNLQPSCLCFSSDHTIWVVGVPRDEQARSDPEFPLLRQYSCEGKPLGALLPRSSFEPSTADSEPGLYGCGGWCLRSTNQRAGFFTSFRRDDNDPFKLWIEIGLDGKDYGRVSIPVGPGIHPTAFTGTGMVYGLSKDGMVQLDRGTGQWKLVSAPSAGKLIGADGNDLVFWVRGQGLQHVSTNP